jgi:hypothetical protein
MPGPEISVDTAKPLDREMSAASDALFDRAMLVGSETLHENEMSVPSDAANRRVEDRRFSAALTIEMIAGF